ncbi:thioesterase domain-containing protein [Streptomyces massasporeus]|uniref:thioesterase domain-containing protein n=1 Tax=Streptomyces massasporeus TaxID=67324 RepID=UPI0036FAD4D8
MKGKAAPRSLVAALNEGRAETAAYLFPGADGGLRQPCAFSAELSGEATVYGVTSMPAGLPGEGVEEIASRCLAAIVRKSGAPPRHVIGYSFGALVALEVAHQTVEQGAVAPTVLLLDTVVRPGEQTASSPSELLWYVGQGAGLDLPQADFQVLDREAQKAAIVHWCGRLSPGFDVNAAETVYRTIEINCEAWGRYRAHPYQGPAGVVVARASSLTVYDREPWTEIFPAGFRMASLPGGHRDVLSAANAVSLAQAVRSLLGFCPIGGVPGP